MPASSDHGVGVDPLSRTKRGRSLFHRPILLFLVACLAIGGVVAAAIVMRSAMRASDEALTETALDLSDAEHLRALRERVSRKMRSYLRVGDERFLIELRQAETEFRGQLSELRAGTENARQLELIDRLEQNDAARQRVTDRLVSSRLGSCFRRGR